jgi:hypothetical protein
MTAAVVVTGISSLIVIVIAVALFFFWISMLIDCVKRPFSRPIYKALWIFALAITQVVGAFVYWLIYYKKLKAT